MMAIPEQDGWIYSGEVPRDGMVFVCSAYSASVWKAAGLFGDATVNATEFTPRDIYMVDFFDKNSSALNSVLTRIPICLTASYLASTASKLHENGVWLSLIAT